MCILPITQNSNYKWTIYTISGINYLNTVDYDNTLYYYNKAINLKTDQYRNTATLNNIALELKEYQGALKKHNYL